MATATGPKARNYCIVRHPRAVTRSARVLEVSFQFGLPPHNPPIRLVENLNLDFAPGSITYLCGPSGSGKTALLQAIARTEPQARRVAQVVYPKSRAVIDAVASRGSLGDALSILTACAFGEPRLWIRDYRDLSDGERFRARLARAVSIHLAAKSKGPLLCDEFCAILHRRVAKAIAYNLRKFIRRCDVALVVATTHDDLVADLSPDQIVRFDGLGNVTRITRTPKQRPISFARRLTIERGRKSDYEQFAPMHYRQAGDLGFVDKVFLLRDGVGGDPLGIVVYAYPPIELSLRNKATNRRFVRNPKRLNREVRILRRLVVHPDVRGCGLGHDLVARTLPRVGVPYVECLAAMGEVNPVFEKANMRRIGLCPISTTRQRLLRQLRDAGADPMAPDFATQVCRRPRVRRLVIKGIAQWVRTISAGRSTERIALRDPLVLAHTFRQLAGSRPVYYLWSRTEDALR